MLKPGRRGVAGADLRGRIAAEQRRLADVVGEHVQPVADAAIEVADGAVVLGARHQPALGRGAVVVGRMDELGRVAEFLALGPLEKDEMIEHAAREAGELDDDAGGMVAGRDREIRPRQMRAGADRHHQVAGQRQVGHLLDGDRGDGVAPALDRRRLLRRQAVALAALEAPRGVEVAAHQVVLDRRGLGEQIDQLLARLDPDLRFFLRHAFPLLRPVNSGTGAGRTRLRRQLRTRRSACGGGHSGRTDVCGINGLPAQCRSGPALLLKSATDSPQDSASDACHQLFPSATRAEPFSLR